MTPTELVIHHKTQAAKKYFFIDFHRFNELLFFYDEKSLLILMLAEEIFIYDDGVDENHRFYEKVEASISWILKYHERMFKAC